MLFLFFKAVILQSRFPQYVFLQSKFVFPILTKLNCGFGRNRDWKRQVSIKKDGYLTNDDSIGDGLQ